MRKIARSIVLYGLAVAALAYAGVTIREQARLDRVAAERDAAAEQNRINYLEWERQQRAIPVGRPMGKPQAGQRDT